MSFCYPKKFIATPLKNTVKGIKNAVIGSQWLTIPGGLPNALTIGLNSAKTVNAFIKRDSLLIKTPAFSVAD